jgi:polar amino acid transport system substrate-binding protein
MNVDGVQTLVGVDIEIGKAIAAAVGKNLKVVNKSFDYLLDDLQSGKVDFVIAGMTPTAERAEKVDFSRVYYEAVQVVLVAEANLSNFTSIAALDVATNRIGAQIGSIQQDLVTDTFLSAQTMFLTAIPDLVLKVQQGQLEALVVEGPVASGYVENMEGLAIAPFTIGELDGGSAVAVQKDNADLLATINTVLANLISSGAMEDIIQAMIEQNAPVTE